ncbi:MAG: DUF120 domain-containing protein [Candidatus Hydrothermarchaeales archaeon]
MDLIMLITLAKLGAYEKMVEISSSKLASKLDTSQQTASRKIKALENTGHIEREILSRGQRIKITQKGQEALQKIYTDLNCAFGEKSTTPFIIQGILTSGMGEGRYYMEREGYRNQFKEKLGFDPYPGTLNLSLKREDDIRKRKDLQNLDGIPIEGFTLENRTFGSVKCFKATIEDVNGAIVIPKRTHHGFDTLEVIAPQKIRDQIELKDGDVITVEVSINE